MWSKTGLVVASFNLWVGGERADPDPARSRALTLQAMRQLDADVLCVQEHKRLAEWYAAELGLRAVVQDDSTAILTRLEVVGATDRLWGARLRSPELGRDVWVFNAHFPHAPYQPYQLAGIPYQDGRFVDSAAEAATEARLARGENVIRCLREAGPALRAARSSGDLVVVAGDFNEPSALDWTAASCSAWGRIGPVDWPATRTLLDAGLSDAFRAVNPDPVAEPGFTWTTRPGKEEVHDRIDMVLYAGRDWRPLSARTVDALQDKALVWPSDHRAVRVQFECKSHRP